MIILVWMIIITPHIKGVKRTSDIRGSCIEYDLFLIKIEKKKLPWSVRRHVLRELFLMESEVKWRKRKSICKWLSHWFVPFFITHTQQVIDRGSQFGSLPAGGQYWKLRTSRKKRGQRRRINPAGQLHKWCPTTLFQSSPHLVPIIAIFLLN